MVEMGAAGRKEEVVTREYTINLRRRLHVLMHTGYCRPTTSPPPAAAIQELCATIRVLPPKDWYISTLRNNVRSHAGGAAIGCSYRNERCCIVKKGGETIDLEPCLTYTSTIEPTLAPVAVERTMTTRPQLREDPDIHLKYVEA
ncbi:zinc finger CCCH domain protein [Trifolium repens]|nr:zinc finger CCCH domain protein [Trifolium repens]